MIIRKSAAEIETMARGGRGRRRDARAARPAHRARRDDGRARRAGRGRSSAPRAACRPSRATRATRPRRASRRTAWSCTGSRARRRSRTATSSRSTSESRSTGSSPTRPGRSPSARSRAETQRLLDVCRAALEAGIEQARVGNTVSDISRAVQTVTEEAGFSVIRSLVGHGVGRSMHEEPQVPNFVSRHRGPELREGMTIAIEPMITVGAPEVYIHDDEWSISTSRRLPRRPLRAHRRGHRGRPANPDSGSRGPGTMTTRVGRRTPVRARRIPSKRS